jgi:hypothetical protein
MPNDWSKSSKDAKTKSDTQLEIEVEMSNSLGGNEEMRAIARAEIKRREREAAESLAAKQIAVAERQAKTAKWSVLAAWGSATATLIAGAVPLIEKLLH